MSSYLFSLYFDKKAEKTNAIIAKLNIKLVKNSEKDKIIEEICTSKRKRTEANIPVSNPVEALAHEDDSEKMDEDSPPLPAMLLMRSPSSKTPITYTLKSVATVKI